MMQTCVGFWQFGAIAIPIKEYRDGKDGRIVMDDSEYRMSGTSYVGVGTLLGF